jgi:hypothetical protein
MAKKRSSETAVPEATGVKHVGGVTDQLGGVDPEADNTLMRLAGGP